MHNTHGLDLALALRVFNKIANPYLLAGWKPAEGDLDYAYEWPQGDVQPLAVSVLAEEKILKLLEAEKAIATQRHRNLNANHNSKDGELAAELYTDSGLVPPLFDLTGAEPKLAWSLAIKQCDKARFVSFIDKHGFELIGIQVFAKPPVAYDLTAKLIRVGSDFAVHSDNTISYRGRRVVLTGQQSRVAAAIMLASVHGGRITSEAIGQIVGRSQATKVVSELRQSFRNVTGQPEHEYFVNLKGIGYTFQQ